MRMETRIVKWSWIVPLALWGCASTPELIPGERQIETSVEGAKLLTESEMPPAAPPSAETTTNTETSSDTQNTASASNQDNAASPFDPDAVYLAALQDIIPDNRPITIERSEPLTVPQLLEAMAKFGGFNIAVAEGLDQEKISKVNFPNIPLRDAFVAILKRYNLNIARIGNVLWIEQGNQAGDEMVYRVMRLSSIAASSLGGQLGQILSGGSGGGGGSAVPAAAGSGGSAAAGSTSASTPNGFFTIHPDSNTIFIRAKPALVEAMAKFIHAVDFRGRQVMIELSLFEVSLDNGEKLGSALSVTDFWEPNGGNSDFASNFLFTGTSDPGTVLDDIATGDAGPDSLGSTTFLFRGSGGTGDGGAPRVTGFLDWLETVATVDLLSSPRLVAGNGKAAEINIIEKIPYIQQTSTAGAGGTTTSNTVVFEEVGIKLKVTPTIQEDQHIRMSIEPEISEEKEKFQSVPVVNKRTTKTEVVVGNQETFALGGLMKNLTNRKEEKVPILGDIPLLGVFFRRTEETTKRVELLILVTPRILNEDADARALSQEYKARIDKARSNGLKKTD